MKKINFIKMALDIIMGTAFALLFNKMVLGGLKFHEIAGVAIGAAFLVHLGLNWRWIKQVSLNIFNGKISIKTRIGYIVDILLFAAMLITIFSGIAISKVLFTNIRFGNSMLLKTAHMSAPYIALILLGIHIGLHWVWALNVFKKIFKISQGKKALNYIAKIMVVVVLAFGIYSIYNNNFFSRISMITRVFNSPQMPNGNIKGSASENIPMRQTPENERATRRPEGDLQEKPNIRGQQAQGSAGNGQLPNRPGGKGGHEPSGKIVGSNPLNVVSSHLGITAAFAIITYYIEKLLVSKNKRKTLQLTSITKPPMESQQ